VKFAELGDQAVASFDHCRIAPSMVSTVTLILDAEAAIPCIAGFAQNELSGCFRNSASSAVVVRPRMALRCGKRPKRWMMWRWASA
jgi:hypothetical protein